MPQGLPVDPFDKTDHLRNTICRSHNACCKLKPRCVQHRGVPAMPSNTTTKLFQRLQKECFTRKMRGEKLHFTEDITQDAVINRKWVELMEKEARSDDNVVSFACICRRRSPIRVLKHGRVMCFMVAITNWISNIMLHVRLTQCESLFA